MRFNTHHVRVRHVHVHVIFEILQPTALQNYDIHWVFDLKHFVFVFAIDIAR